MDQIEMLDEIETWLESNADEGDCEFTLDDQGDVITIYAHGE